MTSKLSIEKWCSLQLHKIGLTTTLFVLIAMVFGLIIVKEVPIFWALDETAHFSRAYQVSEGQLLPQRQPDGNYGGVIPSSIVQLNDVANKQLLAIIPGSIIGRKDFTEQALQKSVSELPIDQHSKESYNFPGSAAYTPITYLAPAAGILICRAADCSLKNTVLIARAFSLISYTLIVAYAIWLIRTKKIKWLVFVIGLLPMTLFQASSVSADGPVLCLSLLLFAILIKAFTDKKLSPFLITVLVVIAISLPLMKVNYGLLDLCIIPVALVIYGNKKKALIYSLSLIFLALLLTLGWVYIARGAAKMIGSLQSVNPATHTYVSAKQQAKFVINNPFNFIETMIRTVVTTEAFWINTTTGEFALNGISMPLTASVYAYIIISGAVFFARSEIIKYKKLAYTMGFAAIVAALSIFGTLYLTFTHVGSNSVAGVQGRYFIPLMTFFFVSLAAIVPVKVSMSPKTAAILFSLSSCAILSLAVIYYGIATY